MGLSEQYSDNFFLTAANKTSNFRTTLSPGLLVGINGPKTRGTLLTSLNVAQDSTDSFGDFSFFPSLSTAVRHDFNPRLSVSLVDTFTRSDEPALSNQFGLQQQRQTFASNTLTLSADWLLDLVATQGYVQLLTFSGGTDTIAEMAGANVSVPLGPLVTARAGYEFSHTDTSGTDSIESTGNLVWASIGRKLGPFNTIGAWTSYSLQSFDSTRIWNLSLFGTYDLPGRLSFSGSLGVSVLSSDNGGTRPVMTTNTTASYRFAKAVIAVAFYQDYNQTFLVGQNFGVTLTRSYTASFGYALTPFIDTLLRANYNQNEFTGVGNTQSSPNANTISAEASLIWRLRPWLTMVLDYTYTRYSSVASSGVAAPVNQATISLAASF